MNTFSSRADIQRFVSDRLPDDLSCYTMTSDDMITEATDFISQYMKDLGFKYGETLPENWFERMFGNDHSKWWELFE